VAIINSKKILFGQFLKIKKQQIYDKIFFFQNIFFAK
jgi:hypothetical protein